MLEDTKEGRIGAFVVTPHHRVSKAEFGCKRTMSSSFVSPLRFPGRKKRRKTRNKSKKIAHNLNGCLLPQF